MNVASVKTHFANWRQWELNPVVIKELRQAVRSWAVTGMLLLFLAVLFCTALALLVSQTFSVSVNQRLGGQVFQAFITVLTVASVIFIPLNVGIRLAAERQDSNLDLLYISTLSPGSIIRGKFFCGAYTAVLFFSACMPFMAFSTLLRGVDLPTIFLVLVYLFAVVCGVVQVAIFLACLPVSKVLKILLAMGGVFFALIISGRLAFALWQVTRSGIGSMMGTRGFWIGFVTVGGISVAGFFLLYFLSVALISPVSANRALPLRIYITATWLLGGVLSVFWIIHDKDMRLILPWAMTTFFVMLPALLVVVSNDDQLSLRVRRDIPVGRFKRMFAFLFFNGAAGGLLWAALLLGITFAVAVVPLVWGKTLLPGFSSLGSEDDNFLAAASATLPYVFAYSLTGLFIHRKLFGKRPPKLAGLLVILLVGAMALAPNIVLFFMNKLSFRALEKFQPGNIFNVFVVNDWSERWTHVGVAVLWLLVAMAVNAKWFLAQMKHFRPLDRSVPPPSPPTSLPPPIPQSVAQS